MTKTLILKIEADHGVIALIDAIRALPILDLYDYKLTVTDNTPTTK